uniref:Uncharacterized protein n=1 Tax=Gallus gallus TaxID=9031 RepID=A0A8V1ABZ8_CHICK
MVLLHFALCKYANTATVTMLSIFSCQLGPKEPDKPIPAIQSSASQKHFFPSLPLEEARRSGNQQHFLHMAALKDESSLAKMLLKCGASIDGKDERGQTALSYAVHQGFENTAEVLLEAGANLPSDIMESALFKAVQKNLHGIVAALADRGTDINAYSEIQYTPLLLACETGKAECAEVLIEKGANLGIKTPASDTALHLAVQAGPAYSYSSLFNHFTSKLIPAQRNSE